MKFLVMLFVLSTATGAYARVNPALLGSTMLTSAPTLLTYCLLGKTPIDDPTFCQAGTLGTYSSTSTSSTLLLLKEEIQQVEQDGYNFLAGEEMSLALEEVVNKALEQAPELQGASDQEVVSLLLSSIQ